MPSDQGCPDGMMGDPATGCFYGCDENADCAAGCWCNLDTGYCEESGFCTTDADCGEGFECDDRSSCVPSDGACETNADCETGLLCDLVTTECRAPTCTETSTDNFAEAAEDMCLANLACDAVYRGTNCTNPNTNLPCEGGDSGCVCQNFIFDRCEDAPAPPPMP